MKKLFGVAVATTILAGCAAPTTRPTAGTQAQIDAEAAFQRELAIQQNVESTKRLYEISGKLRISAADLCDKEVAPFVGAYGVQAADNDNGAALKKLYKLDDRVAALHIVSGSPAKTAGLQTNDVIISIDGKHVPDKKSYEEAVANLTIGKPTSYEIIRGNEKKKLAITPVAACKYPAQLSPAMELNAFADGDKIMVTQGMMNFAQTDEELALVVSHEIAHNMMKHIESKKTNAMGGLFVDLLLAVATKGAYKDSSIANIAGQAYSQEFESEADYVGLYIMARSGYKIDDAPKFWRRMAVAHPGNIKTNHTASHPSTAARMVALDSAVAEIRQKQTAKLPLLPNKKEKQVATNEQEASN